MGKGFIPGEEVTGAEKVHATAMNVTRLVDWKVESKDKTEILQSHVHRTHAAGGESILNHPNWKLALLAKESPTISPPTGHTSRRMI